MCCRRCGQVPRAKVTIVRPTKRRSQGSLSVFAASPDRIRILRGLLAYRAPLRQRGISSGFQWLDGSFLEHKEGLGYGAEIVRVIDYEDADANDWLVVNQLTVIEGQHNRRADVVVYINGLALGVIELKNAADENADIWQAFASFRPTSSRSRRCSSTTRY